jgi:hypothetical protein
MKEMPFREEVYAGGRTDAALLDNLLQVEGIETIVTADRRYSRIGPHVGSSVYVLDPAHVERARTIVDRYRRNEPLKDPRSYRSWRCRACNELVEGQFEVCWQCGGPRQSGQLPQDQRPTLQPPPPSILRAADQPARPLRDAMVMVVFLLAALFLMFASSGRRRAGQLPQQALPSIGQR